MKLFKYVLIIIFLLTSSTLYAGKTDNGNISISNGVVSDVSGQVFPIGMVAAFTTATAPAGWLECNGQAVSRTTYSSLFGIVGVIYGAGDASTTFNVPDLRGRFLRSYSNGTSTDPDKASRTDRGDGTGGDVVGSKQSTASKLPNSAFTSSSNGNHTHGVWWYNAASPAEDVLYGIDNIATNNSDNVQSSGSHVHSISTGGDNETRSTNINVMWCIKY